MDRDEKYQGYLAGVYASALSSLGEGMQSIEYNSSFITFLEMQLLEASIPSGVGTTTVHCDVPGFMYELLIRFAVFFAQLLFLESKNSFDLFCMQNAMVGFCHQVK